MYGAHTILLYIVCCSVVELGAILLYIVCCSFVHNVTELGAVPPVDEKEDETDMYDVPDKKPTSPLPLLDQKAQTGHSKLLQVRLHLLHSHIHICVVSVCRMC